MHRSKRYQAALKQLTPDKLYTVDEAIGLVGRFEGSKFDETVEVALQLGVDPKKPDQAIRGTISLP